MNEQANKAKVDRVERPPLSERERSEAGLSRLIALHWKLIAAIALATTGIAWLVAVVQTPTYRATALAAVAPLSAQLPANEVLRGVEVLERRTVIATVAALASTDATRTQAAAGSGYGIEAAVLPNTNLFRVNVEGSDGAEAVAIANRVPAVLSKQTEAMYKYYGVTVVSPAGSASPFRPRQGRAVAAGLLIGLFLGLLAAYAMQRRAAGRGSAT